MNKKRKAIKTLAVVMASVLSINSVEIAGVAAPEEYGAAEVTYISAGSNEKTDPDILRATDGKYFSYTLDKENNATITRYKGKAANVTIPSALEGHPVTKIGESAFANNKKLTKVVIPDSVFFIEKSAFEGCTGIVDLTLSNDLYILSQNAFAYCSSLQSIRIPKALEIVESSPFKECNSLKRIEFEEGITMIPDELFSCCRGLEEVVIPNTVKKIGRNSFGNCAKLAKVTLPDHLEELGSLAFYATDITSIEIPESLTTLGQYSFGHCSKLEKIVLPRSMKWVRNGAFYYCENLSEIVLPDTIEEIEESAFANTAITSLVLPDGVESIKYSAFAGCKNLKTVVLGKGTTYLGKDAFRNCTSLESITLDDKLQTIEQGAFEDCSALKSVVLPNSVSSLGNNIFSGDEALETVQLGNGISSIPTNMFNGCKKLDDVDIPYSVAEIGSGAFAGCENLKKVTIPRATVKIGDNAFQYADRLTIYGVKGSYAQNYASKIKASFKAISVPATKVQLDQTKVNMKPEETYRLNVIVTPEDFTDTVIWKSDNERVVKVDSVGNLTAVGLGTTKVSVSVGTKKAYCTVRVDIPVEHIFFGSYSDLHLEAGETVQFSASVYPKNATDPTFTWSSSDETIASVNKNGLVTAKKKGTAVITATANDGHGVKQTRTVQVKNNLYECSKVSQLHSAHNYENNCSDVWTYTIKGAEALLITFDSRTKLSAGDVITVYGKDKAYTWNYTGTELASGTIRMPGDTVKIRLNSDEAVTDWGFAVTDVKKEVKVTGITLNKKALKLEPGQSVTLKATVVPDHASNKSVEWSSSNEKVATVNSKGVVKAIGVGKTVITVEAQDGSGKKATCELTVAREVQKITLNKTSLELRVGKSANLTATIAPADATDKSVTWTSSDKKIATVDANGKVTAKGRGTVTITAKANDGSGVKKTCKVKVTQLVTKAFKDVPADAWYVSAVQFVYDRGIMNGTSETTFSPTMILTRGQFVTVLYNMENRPAVKYNKKIFKDVKEEDYFALPVMWAAKNDITSGIGGGSFGPDQNITREQLATMLYKYAILKGYKTDIDKKALNDFPDRKKVSDWAKESMQWAVTNKVISGKAGKKGNILDPKGQASRAECAQMIKNLLAPR